MSNNASCVKMGKKIKLVKKTGLKKVLPLSEKTAQRLSSQLAGFLQIDCESSSSRDKSASAAQDGVMANNSTLQGEGESPVGCASRSEAECPQPMGTVNVNMAGVVTDKTGPTWAEWVAAQENTMAEHRSQFPTQPDPHDFVQSPMSIQTHGRGRGCVRTHGLDMD